MRNKIDNPKFFTIHIIVFGDIFWVKNKLKTFFLVFLWFLDSKETISRTSYFFILKSCRSIHQPYFNLYKWLTESFGLFSLTSFNLCPVFQNQVCKWIWAMRIPDSNPIGLKMNETWKNVDLIRKAVDYLFNNNISTLRKWWNTITSKLCSYFFCIREPFSQPNFSTTHAILDHLTIFIPLWFQKGPSVNICEIFAKKFIQNYEYENRHWSEKNIGEKLFELCLSRKKVLHG